mmetsp:Transcript_18970/g.24148  ORF Transcript_18970/g.24148 Transcript_18970/m.24148 type:complete len:377 (-) Transcript_18970:129-1259(-)
MHILITGSSSSIGRNLLTLLSSNEFIGDCEDPITEVTLADIDYTRVSLPVTSFVVGKRKIDIAGDGPSCVEELFYGRPEFIFHLASLSEEADFDFDRGYRVNVDGTKNMLDAIRAIPGYCPRFVFASSIAAPSQCSAAPQDSYDTQKAIAELLVSEYSRKGYVDGISIRLPTIVGCPDATHKAATSFFPSMIREPLSGHEAICPVPLFFRHTIASPKAAAGNLLHAANLTSQQLAMSRTMNMPGIAPAVHDIIEALGNIAGKSVAKLIHQERDISIWRTVSSWPQNIDATYALSLGFVPDASIDAIIKYYIKDELKQKKHSLPTEVEKRHVEDDLKQKKCSLPSGVEKRHVEDDLKQKTYSIPTGFGKRQLSGAAA